MKVLILKDKAIPRYNSGFQSLNALSMIEFESQEQANYFIDNYDPQCNDYKECMPVDEEVKFSVFHDQGNKLIQDDMIKSKNWKPFKL